jgi:hypothetical protein
LEEIGAEFTDTVDGTFDELIKGARKKSPEKKMFKALKPEVKAVEKGWTKILNVVNTAWDTLWDTIFWPFKQAWKWIKSLAAKIAKWLEIVAKGSKVFAKVARGFQKVFTAIKGKHDIPFMSRVFFSFALLITSSASRAWKAIAKAGSYYWAWITKLRPIILKHGAKWLGKIVSAVGWATLLFDVVRVSHSPSLEYTNANCVTDGLFVPPTLLQTPAKI